MYNVYGVLCDTYEEACIVAGIETPAQLAAEARWEAEEAAIEHQDRMEALGGPDPALFAGAYGWDDIPF